MTEGLATLADDDCVILLVKHNGKWITYEGHQEIDFAYGREQVPSRPITDDDILAMLLEDEKQ